MTPGNLDFCVKFNFRTHLALLLAQHVLTDSLPYKWQRRVVEMETLDLGLTPEGEALNNRSVRDRTNTHQHNKAKKPLAAVFNDRFATALAATSVKNEGGAETEGQDEVEGEGEGEEEGEGASEGEKKEGGAVVHQHFKRRRIQFRNVSDAELAAQDGVKPEAESDPVDDAVYNQNGMSDEQFISLQNRIKNRPVSAVNGTYEMHIARPISGMKGHTAFLTFAVCPLQS